MTLEGETKRKIWRKNIEKDIGEDKEKDMKEIDEEILNLKYCTDNLRVTCANSGEIILLV